jgi:hypothetical protein
LTIKLSQHVVAQKPKLEKRKSGFGALLEEEFAVASLKSVVNKTVAIASPVEELKG